MRDALSAKFVKEWQTTAFQTATPEGTRAGKNEGTPSCGSRSNVSSVLGTCQGYGSSSVALLRLWRLLEPSESFAGCGLIAAFRLRAPRADPAGQCADNSV